MGFAKVGGNPHADIRFNIPDVKVPAPNVSVKAPDAPDVDLDPLLDRIDAGIEMITMLLRETEGARMAFCEVSKAVREEAETINRSVLGSSKAPVVQVKSSPVAWFAVVISSGALLASLASLFIGR